MPELSDLPSSKTSPMRFIAIIDGAASGLIDTACICPTSSSCGTLTLRKAIKAIQARIIGTARVRIIRAATDLLIVGTGGGSGASIGASVVGALMLTSGSSRSTGSRR